MVTSTNAARNGLTHCWIASTRGSKTPYESCTGEPSKTNSRRRARVRLPVKPGKISGGPTGASSGAGGDAKVLLPTLTAAVLFEGVTGLYRYGERARLFKQAQARALELRKPLVVIGAPNAGGLTAVIGSPYGCGDLCVDLHGCPECGRQVAVDITKDPIPLPQDSAVVFVSCVLEYVDDINAAWAELKRVGGANVFVAIVGGGTLTSYAFPGAKWVLDRKGTGFVAYRINGSPGDGSTMSPGAR